MYVTAQGCRLRNDLYCVEWHVKRSYYTIPSRDAVRYGTSRKVTFSGNPDHVMLGLGLQLPRRMSTLSSAQRFFILVNFFLFGRAVD